MCICLFFCSCQNDKSVEAQSLHSLYFCTHFNPFKLLLFCHFRRVQQLVVFAFLFLTLLFSLSLSLSRLVSLWKYNQLTRLNVAKCTAKIAFLNTTQSIFGNEQWHWNNSICSILDWRVQVNIAAHAVAMKAKRKTASSNNRRGCKHWAKERIIAMRKMRRNLHHFHPVQKEKN